MSSQLRIKNEKYSQKLNEKLLNVSGDKKTKELLELVVKISKSQSLETNKQLFFELINIDSLSLKEMYEKSIKYIYEAALNKDLQLLFKQMFLRLDEYSYQNGMFRRALNTKVPIYLKERVIEFVLAIYFQYDDFEIMNFLNDPNSVNYDYYKPSAFILEAMLAQYIDNGNEEVIQTLKEIINSETNTITFTHTMLRGISKSQNTDLYKDVMNLLNAAKLQEGVRQMILEAADSGAIEYFKLVVKTIIDLDLARFSSCVRAINTWVGFGYDTDNKREIKMIIALIDEYLSDENKRNVILDTNHTLELYLSLWATGVYEAVDALELAKTYLKGNKHQKLIAAYFLNQLQSAAMTTTIALDYIDDEDLDVFAYLSCSIKASYASLYNQNKDVVRQAIKNNSNIKAAANRQKLFDIYAKKIIDIPKEGYHVLDKPFQWSSFSVQRESLLYTMFFLCILNKNDKNVSRMIERADMADSYIKINIIKYLLDTSKEVEKQYLLAYLEDKSVPVREAAVKELKAVDLSDEEVINISELLRLKTGGIRQTIIELIAEQVMPCQEMIINNLIKDKLVTKRLAALDLLLKMSRQENCKHEFIQESIQAINKPTKEEMILIEQLSGKDKQGEYTKENGYGLYEPDCIPDFKQTYKDTKTINEFINVPVKRLIEILTIFSKFIEEYKDYEYDIRYYNGNRDTVIFGGSKWWSIPFDKGIASKYDASFEDYVLNEEIEKLILDNHIKPIELLRLSYLNCMGNSNTGLLYNQGYFDEYIQLFNETFKIDDFNDCYDLWKDIPYRELAVNIVAIYTRLKSDNEIFNITYNILSDFIALYGKRDIFKENMRDEGKSIYGTTELKLFSATEIMFFINLKRESHRELVNFKKSIALSYKLASLQDYVYIGLEILDIVRAVEENILPVNELYRTFFNVNPAGKMKDYTSKIYREKREHLRQYPILKEVSNNVIERVIEIEMKRGDSVTDVSAMAEAINTHYGVKHFVNLLVALGNESFIRGYAYSSVNSKKEVLSSLLKACYPSKYDTQEAFNQAMKGIISDERLIEAVMYVPAWANYLENYLGWAGVKSAIWYFHAHSNDSVSAEYESEIAPFSPISRVDFQDGAFDINWYMNTYKMLGKKRFDLFFNSAKYISGGSSHRRAQLFVEAVQNKLRARTLEKEIIDKRNKDKLLSYGLIPLGKNAESEALKRYEFIHKFLKQSKEFGAQRRESEKKASHIALINLAQNLGYEDTNIFSWRMECAKLESISKYFEAKMLDVYEVALEIDEEGSASIIVISDDKRLKSVPTKLKKDKYILELSEVVKSLKEQYVRAKESFENAMISQTEFIYQDIIEFTNHPVINAIMKTLVFACNNRFGFIHGNEFVDDTGKHTNLNETELLQVAHPYALMTNKVWSNYQKYVFDMELVQPFKQVFRELYTINADEKESNTISRRYAGHQIQPQKTVALLKTRGWNVYYEEGLQKVDFKHNVISRMYAIADWFSPADNEAPTMETVEFFDRISREHIAFDKINPILFSETMRDVDLVVAVAHVGGVDPQASHSTIEMRRVLVEETLRLMKINNVIFTDKFAKVKGHYGEYNIHLGSGQIQMQAKGSVNILAVQSQHRGKLFLPFLDEDPRTAEIVSKIVLLANDTAIKDPMILEQIK